MGGNPSVKSGVQTEVYTKRRHTKKGLFLTKSGLGRFGDKKLKEASRPLFKKEHSR